MNEGNIVRDLTKGNPLTQLLKFAFPFILANLLQQAYNMVDLIVVGRYVGSAGLAAVASGGEMAMLFLFSAIGFTSGGQVVIAQHLGAGSRDKLGRSIGTLFTFVMAMGLVFMVLAFVACDWVLGLMNVPPEAMDYAHDYSMIYFAGMLPVCGYNVVSSVLRGLGDSKHPFMFIAVAAILNVILDVVFVGPLQMSCKGAALATVISQIVAFIVSMVFLYRHQEELGFRFRRESFQIDKKELSSMVRIGTPLCVMNVAVGVSMMVIAHFVNAYGVVAAAASAVGNKITMLATICTAALTTAGNSAIAQNFAAGEYKRVSQILLWVLVICLAFTGLLALILALFPEQVFAIFDDDPAVLALSHSFVLPGVIGLLGFATRSAGFAFCNGIGNAKLSFYGGLFDGLVARIGLGWLFGVVLDMGVRGFWLGNAIAGHIIGLVVLPYYFFSDWRSHKLLV